MAVYELPKLYHPDFISPRVKPVGAVNLDLSNSITADISDILYPTLAGVDKNLGANWSVMEGGYEAKPTSIGAALTPNGQRLQSSTLVDVSGNFTAMIVHKVLDITGVMVASSVGNYWMGQVDAGVLVSNSATDSVAATAAIGDEYVLIGQSDGTNIAAWANGVKGSDVASPTTTSGVINVMDYSAGGFNYTGNISLVVYWNRRLSDAEIISLSIDPYQILKPAVPISYFTADDSGGTPLTPQDISQGQTLGNVTLTQSNVLVVDDINQSQSIDEPTLTQAHVLAVQDINQGQSIDEPVLTQSHVLAVDDINQSQSIDEPTLTQAHILAVDGINQGQSIDNVILAVQGALVVQNINQSQSIDEPTLTQNHVLSVDGINQGQSIDIVNLVQQHILSVDSLAQSQTLENVILAAGGTVVSPDDINQGQSIDEPTLTQHGILLVDNLTQAQLLSVVNLGGIVVGYLEGELSVFSAYNTEILVTNALTGETSILS